DVEGHEPTVITELLNSAVGSQIRNIYFEADESRYDVGAVVSTLLGVGFVQIFRNGVGKPYDLMFERAQLCGVNLRECIRASENLFLSGIQPGGRLIADL